MLPLLLAAGAGGLVSGIASIFGGNSAAHAQEKAAWLGNQQQNRMFKTTMRTLHPFVEKGKQAMGDLGQYQNAGGQALGQQMNLLGLNGQGAQQQAYDAMQNSAAFQAMAGQGENAILQNASATGGLRGGNTQAALAQFRPGLLNSMIQQQYGQLSGLSAMGNNTSQNMANMGQNAAAMQGNAAMQTGQNIAAGYNQMGAAQAGNYLNTARSIGNFANAPYEAMITDRYLNSKVI